ncbi:MULTISPECIES: YqkE family protein [Paenibacillus]|uniref:YqkE family protein n=1 Tax=Paenibacillus TaxID=44249 RepID=UPI0022B866FA|nr:YqkE family protein [Paenibacillus caseinilyticus]MCZ8521191.1 YqkE family protein [Paenibacillus caseinilyticus]
MVKRRGGAPAPKPSSEEKPATLKDLLGADVLQKLKAQSESMKAEAEQQKEEARKRAEEARKAEQKRLDNDFGHLLSNSDPNWRKFK